MTSQILIIDGDKKHSNRLKQQLETMSCELVVSQTPEEAVENLRQSHWDIVLANPFGRIDLSECLLSTKKENSGIQLIVFARKDRLNAAMDVFSTQAFSYLEKPVNKKKLSFVLASAEDQIRLIKENKKYARQVRYLNDNQDLLNQLFDEVPCNISVQNKDLVITKTNKEFNYHFGESIGQHCYAVYKKRTTPCPECPVARTFEDGRSHRTEETVTSKSGQHVNVLTQTAPIKDKNGQITRVMELSINISQIRQLQDHLASLGLMLGSMFHGVKGTLTALDGGIYQLETGISQNDLTAVTNAHSQIKTMAEKIKKMVAEILDYAKSRELNYEQVDVKKFVKSVVETSRPLAKKALVRLKVDIPEHPGTIEVDAGWLEAALVNFLENGVEACQVEKKKKTHSVLLAVNRPDRDQICFTVSDNGIGMDQEIKDKLFNLFFTSKGPTGTGLGMFIANRVIRYHGGRVEFVSKPGRGTTFNIFLPTQKPGKPSEENLMDITTHSDILDADEYNH